MTDTIYDVIIIGAGPAGLSAAHELAERKLNVCILESAPFIGGKPISALGFPLKPPKKSANEQEIQAFLTASVAENNTLTNHLPIEHAFRVYPENYNNLLSIMRRIPIEEGKNVTDRLTNTLHLAEYVIPIVDNQRWRDRVLAKFEKLLFGLALYTPYILCDERSFKYDEISIADLFQLAKRSPELQAMILCLTDSLSSGMMSATSSLAVINILMNYYYAPGRTGFRTFNCPTHIAWLKPWEKYLREIGVTIHLSTPATHVTLAETSEGANSHTITEVIAMKDGVKKIFRAKYIICATPVDVLQKLINQNYEMLRYDSRLLDIFKIMTLPATGIQLYYEEPIKGIDQKLLAGSMVTHPWGISYVAQNGYWAEPEKYTGSYGVITIYIAVINQEGRFIKKSLQKCTANEIAYEMFTEIEDEFTRRGLDIPERVGYFTHSYQQEAYLTKTDNNPVLEYHFNGTYNEDLLHLCVLGMHRWRPLPETIYLGNLILCGSYAQNKTFYVSTMESASESGRRAANTILNKFGLEPLCIYDVETPKIVRFLRKLDKVLYKFWLPNPIDLVLSFLRKVVNSRNIHMDPSIRSYENLHW